MKFKYALTVLIFLAPSAALADRWVNGYTKKDGTYVQGYQKTNSDNYRYNNYSSQTNGNSKRDEFSSGSGATNKSNNTYNFRDNDNDGVLNTYDRAPETKKRW